MPLVASAYAHLVAAIAFGETSQPDKRREALEQASRDVKTLEDCTAPVHVFWMRLDYFDYLGEEQNEALLRECRRAQEKIDSPAVAYFCLSRLYRLGQLEEARNLVEQRLPQAASKLDYLAVKGFVVAELANGQADALIAAEAALREVAVTPASAAAISGPHCLLRYLGRNPQAEEACRQIRARLTGPFPFRAEWNKKLLDYNCGELGDEQLLRAAGSSRWDQCEGHFNMALMKLADGNRVGAREHFRQSMATGVFNFYEYRWSRAFLSRMDKDPTWPPWIPVKP